MVEDALDVVEAIPGHPKFVVEIVLVSNVRVVLCVLSSAKGLRGIEGITYTG